jgi:hypothetical protein
MIRPLLVLLALQFPTATFAQSPIVRAGEHGDFTRVTIDLSDEMNWDVVRFGQTLRISFDDETVLSGTDNAFDRIGRQRVSSIQSFPGRLDIRLACNCEYRLFQSPSGLVVIDFFERTPAEVERNLALMFIRPSQRLSFQRSFDENENHFSFLVWPKKKNFPSQEGQSRNGASHVPMDPIFSMVDTDVTSEISDPSGKEVNLLESAFDLLNSIEQRSLERRFAQLSRIQNFESALKEELEHAAGQGLLLRSSSPGDMYTFEPDNRFEAPQIAVHSALELSSSFPFDRKTNGEAKLDQDCIGNDLIGFNIGSSEDSHSEDLRRVRRKLALEQPEPKVETLIELSRIYLQRGFAREAREVLMSILGRAPEVQILHDISLLIEQPGSGDFLIFTSMEVCHSDIALWAVMADPSNEALLRADSNTVLQSFLKLPNPVQRALASHLISGFRSLGEAASAEIVRSSALGSQDVQFAAVLDRDSSIKVDDDGINLQEEDNESSVIGVERSPLEVLVLQIEAAWREKKSITPNTVSKLESYIEQIDQSPDYGDLAAVKIKADLLSGNFESLGRDLQNSSNRIQISDLDAMLDYHSERSSDVSFLTLVFQLSDDLIELVSPSTRERLKERVSSLGFSFGAERFRLPSETDEIDGSVEHSLSTDGDPLVKAGRTLELEPRPFDRESVSEPISELTVSELSEPDQTETGRSENVIGDIPDSDISLQNLRQLLEENERIVQGLDRMLADQTWSQ